MPDNELEATVAAMRHRVEARITFLKRQLYSDVWVEPALRDAYETELAELLPLLKLDSDERGITMHRYRMWDIADQCAEYLAKGE